LLRRASFGLTFYNELFKSGHTARMHVMMMHVMVMRGVETD
jgi:hypothetical protein